MGLGAHVQEDASLFVHPSVNTMTSIRLNKWDTRQVFIGQCIYICSASCSWWDLADRRSSYRIINPSCVIPIKNVQIHTVNKVCNLSCFCREHSCQKWWVCGKEWPPEVWVCATPTDDWFHLHRGHTSERLGLMRLHVDSFSHMYKSMNKTQPSIFKFSILTFIYPQDKLLEFFQNSISNFLQKSRPLCL